MSDKFSIIIIGRNEESGIGKCIEAAFEAASEVGGAEMIYVDSNSTDSTVSVVQGYGVRVLEVGTDYRVSASAGRFLGSVNAHGEFILFLDADTLIYPGFLAQALEHFDAEPSLGGVGGQMDDHNEAGELLSDIEENTSEVLDVKWLRGASCFYRRKALMEAGSFDPGLATEEEAELGLRLKSKGWGMKVLPVKMACHTRCYHGQSIGTIISTFRRDVRSKRLGEVTKTIAHAFAAGNGVAFCWLRLKTTILFAVWLLLILACFFLPYSLYPKTVMVSLALIGGSLIFAKKRSIAQTLLFIPSKLLNLIDVLAGIPKIEIRTLRHSLGNAGENL